MIVRDILTVKGGDIYSTTPSESLGHAVRLMVENDIGSLVVKEGDTMVGLITERDVLRELVRHGCNLTTLLVSDLMITEPIIAGLDDTVDYVRGVMTEHRISHMPVLQDDRLLGIISFHDVAKACLREASFENLLLKRYIKHWPE